MLGGYLCFVNQILLQAGIKFLPVPVILRKQPDSVTCLYILSGRVVWYSKALPFCYSFVLHLGQAFVKVP